MLQPYYLHDEDLSNTLTAGSFYPLGNADAVEHPTPEYLMILFDKAPGWQELIEDDTLTPIFENEAGIIFRTKTS